LKIYEESCASYTK